MMTNRHSPLLTKSAALTLFVIALPGIACAFDPYGTWMRPSTGTQVSFYDCGGKLCGKIVAVKDERRKSKIGTVIVIGATKSAENQWKGAAANVYSSSSFNLRGKTFILGMASTNVGLACDSIVVTRCRLGSTVATLAPKRAAYTCRFSITR